MRHPERIEHAREGSPARRLDALVDVRRALLRETVEAEELFFAEEEDVGRIGDVPALLQLRHESPAHALDVHAPTPDEVTDALTGLRGARGIPAPVRDLALAVLDVATAHRTLLRHLEDGEVLSLLACVDLGAHDLGDDVAGALDHHAVSLAHVEAMHLVVPPTRTGASAATGVSTPVRPT